MTYLNKHLKIDWSSGKPRIYLEGAVIAHEREWLAKEAMQSWLFGKRWTGVRAMAFFLRRRLLSFVDYQYLDMAEVYVLEGGRAISITIGSKAHMVIPHEVSHVYLMDEVDPRLLDVMEVMEE